MEYREYKKINDEIIKIIEDNYSKDFHKAVKKFKIIMAGYNASRYKSLQVFKKYGWEMSVMLGLIFMSCTFEYKISSKVCIELTVTKNMKTGILNPDLISKGGSTGYLTIKDDESDELFEHIKSIDKFVYSKPRNRFGNSSLSYYVCRNEDGSGYILNVSLPCSL